MKYQERISQMTLEEKASLLTGGTQFTTKPIQRLGVPSMFLSDGPHGLRKQAGPADHLGLNPSIPATCFPTAATMAASWDPALGEALGQALGQEAVAQGVSVVLGPGLNIKRSPLCGRNFEYFSEDPYLAGKMAAAYIRGIQSQGVAACPKHFAANSQELLRMHSDSVVDTRTLREIYLTGFEIAVKEGRPLSLMSSYNQINGVYANENPWLLGDVLVDEWGFDGMVVSDWGGSNDHVEAVRAGSHLEMPASGLSADRELVAAVQEGRLSEALLDRRVDEFLHTLFATAIPPEKADGVLDEAGHHDLARRCAEGSVVLLKNEDGFLPLKAGTRVGLIGDFAQTPRYQGAGSSLVNATRLDSTVDLMEGSGLTLVGYEQGFVRNGAADQGLRAKAVALAETCEVVLLYLGLDELGESEGLDRAHMRIHQNQVDLLEAVHAVNPNVAVVLSAGSSLETPWEDRCKAMVYGCLSGQAGAGAVLNVLTGKVNPSGKLAETWPLRLEDAAVSAYYPGKERTAEYREGLYVGYRWFDKGQKPVRYPFGHGLSYTTFAYSDLTATPQGVTFTLENTGPTAGAEVAQLYVSPKSSLVFRPEKELKGFLKVFLQPGEKRTVTIPLDDKAFRYFHPGEDRWVTEGGTYDLLVGASAAEVRLTAQVEVEGERVPSPYDTEKLPSYHNGAVSDVSDVEFAILLGRPIPPSRWDRSKPLGRNDSISQLFYAKGLSARLAYKILSHMRQKAEKRGSPDLNILFIINIPFRGIAKMMGGAFDMAMVDALLEAVNGHFFRGVGHLLSARSRMRKADKEGRQS